MADTQEEQHPVGEPHVATYHAACSAAGVLEPPRYCSGCGRRMKVQVLPDGWRAVCVEHGTLSGV